MLKSGVWYCLLKPTGGTLAVNQSDSVTLPAANGNLEVRPRLGAGLNVRNTGKQVRLPLQASPSRHHYKVYLYADSSAEYHAVKEAISARGGTSWS